jgi:phage terminase large subunit GpA-like protein
MTLLARTLARFAPPPRLRLSEWIEGNVYLPESSAIPGVMRLWPYQREIADAIGDPSIERVTLLKASRIGFTALLVGALGAYVAHEPSSILVLLPTEADARDFTVSDLEPTFGASPALRTALAADRPEAGRDTLLSRRFPGGSLKVLAARAPRNLRRHTAKILLCDEIDAMEVTREGSALNLAEKRTLTFSDRKIVVGSTPTFSDTSAVLREYGESDQRIYEVPCPSCGGFTEIMWAHIRWPDGEPDKAAFRCPHCEALIEERFKAQMVSNGQWRATRPEIVAHAGFRLNSLVSLLANATWGRLAVEFLAAKADVSLLQVFTNTILAEGWAPPGLVDANSIASRVEDFDLDHIPREVLWITVGVDVQDDRLEMSVVGWDKDQSGFILDHSVIWGSYQSLETWRALDEALRVTWKHPFGSRIGVSAAAVDCADGGHFQKVIDFCAPRMSRRIFATKAMNGPRPMFEMSKGRTAAAGKFAILSHDAAKNAIFDRLSIGRGLRFSNSLTPYYFEMLARERRVTRRVKGVLTRQFVSSGRNESLDCLCYALCIRSSLALNVERRIAELRGEPIERRSIASQLAGAGRPLVRPSLASQPAR